MPMPMIQETDLPGLNWANLDTRPVWHRRGRGWSVVWLPATDVMRAPYIRCDTCGLWAHRKHSLDGRCLVCGEAAYLSMGITEGPALERIWFTVYVAVYNVILHLIRNGVIDPEAWSMPQGFGRG